MKRVFLSVLPVLALAVAGASRVSAQSSLELVDRAQKDLQARYAVKRAKAEAAATPRPEPDRTDEMVMQNALIQFQQARQYLASDNEEAALNVLSQLGGMSGAPEEVKTLTDPIVQKLQAEHADKQAAFVSGVDAACKRAASAVLVAKEPKDLDATLEDLNQLADKVDNRYGDNGNSRAHSKWRAATTFVSRWQDYLLARDRKNESAVSSALRNLAENDNQFLLIPRSQILALTPQTETESESSSRNRHTGRPQAQLDAEAVDIVQGVRTLADVPAALSKLGDLRKELATHGSYSLSSESDLGAALTSLQALQKTAVELQNGVAADLNLGSGRPDLNAHSNIENPLLPLRIELVKLAAPRLLGAPEDTKPAEGEALDAYLRRLIEAAKKRQDWDAVVRGLELKRKLAASTTSGNVVGTDQEVTAYKNFFAGRNLELAGQYEQAAISYLTALRSGQEDLPAALIGQSLAAIQKDHAAEYTTAANYVLNPPVSNVDPLRFGPPGQYRGGMYDPRFLGRPGFPGMPGMPPTPNEDRIAVPAASPAPAVTPATPTPPVTPSPSAH